MINKRVISVSAMGLAKDNLIINKSEDVIYLIDDEISVCILDNVNASFIDVAKDKNINIKIGTNSSVDYIIIDGINSKRNYQVYGEINITEISLSQSVESIHIDLNQEYSAAFVKCLAVCSNMKNIYNQYISHNSKSTISNIMNVGVAINNANISYDTTGKINKGNSASKCQQISRGIVMDNNSEITAKPILLIDEYDCFANHGAAIGKMSDEDLFYLMSRGLKKNEAFMLILQGIIAPFIETIQIDEWKDKIQNQVFSLIESD